MGLSAMLCIGIYILWRIVIVCRYHPISGFRKGLEYQREITMAKSTDKKKVVAKEAEVQEDAIRLESGSDLSSESGESRWRLVNLNLRMRLKVWKLSKAATISKKVGYQQEAEGYQER